MNKNKVIYGIVLILVILTMFFWIDKKVSFHEDEIFAFAASSSDEASVYLPYGKMETISQLYIDKNPFKMLKNIFYYKFHPEEFNEKFKEIEEKHSPIWKTNEEAKEFVTMDKDEFLNFHLAYYHAAQDIHPPLFYLAAHTAMMFFVGNFSKYALFGLNMIFMLLACHMIKEILKTLKKEHLIIPTIIFYALSLGGISTVMFQRMYMMMTFFTLWFLNLNLKIYFEGLDNKKIKIQLIICTILGFLTQYYFCLYAAFVAILMIFFKRKDKEFIKKYILQIIISAVIGVAVYPFSIYDMFFSYRGISASHSEIILIEKIYLMLKNLALAQFGTMDLAFLATLVIVTAAMLKSKTVKNKELISILVIPVVLYVSTMILVVPFMSLRYMMNVLPIISIIIILIMERLYKNRSRVTIGLTILASLICLYSNIVNKPYYLYEKYEDYMEIANENKDLKFVFVGNTQFIHMRNMQEFMIYEESLLLKPDELDVLIDDEKLKNENEFMLCIQKIDLDEDKVLKEVMEKTGFSKSCELLNDNETKVNCKIYKISR